jgi:hypothetical protein
VQLPGGYTFQIGVAQQGLKREGFFIRPPTYWTLDDDGPQVNQLNQKQRRKIETGQYREDAIRYLDQLFERAHVVTFNPNGVSNFLTIILAGRQELKTLAYWRPSYVLMPLKTVLDRLSNDHGIRVEAVDNACNDFVSKRLPENDARDRASAQLNLAIRILKCGRRFNILWPDGKRQSREPSPRSVSIE